MLRNTVVKNRTYLCLTRVRKFSFGIAETGFNTLFEKKIESKKNTDQQKKNKKTTYKPIV